MLKIQPFLDIYYYTIISNTYKYFMKQSSSLTLENDFIFKGESLLTWLGIVEIQADQYLHQYWWRPNQAAIYHTEVPASTEYYCDCLAPKLNCNQSSWLGFRPRKKEILLMCLIPVEIVTIHIFLFCFLIQLFFGQVIRLHILDSLDAPCK